MKKTIKIIFIIIVLGIIYLASYLYFKGFPVGYENNYIVVYSHTCADMQCTWYKKYFGNISYDQCSAIGGSPKLVGLIKLGADGKPGKGSIGGYDGCQPQ